MSLKGGPYISGEAHIHKQTKCRSLTALNVAVINYSLHDSSYASGVLLRMIDRI